jgi:arginyl-tRNA--protein-N-Asp/Glu arginylyltransferase
MRRFRNYLSGEYELNKEKIKQKEEQKNDVKMKNIDEHQEKIEKKLKDYLKQKNFFQIIEKYIKIDNSLLDKKLNEIHVRKNTNKKFNFDYSIDFIYVTLKIIESENQKNKTIFDNAKNLQLDLFNNFKDFYKSENEELELSDKTGHINIIDKTKPKKMIEENKIEKKIENKKKDAKIEKKEKKKEKENLKKVDPEKYSLEYFPEIVNEPEIHLPLKHIYTCELTDKIQIDDERFQIYKKYQMNIHKEKEVETTKSSYNRAWGTTDLIDNKGIKLPSDLNKKTKHPEMYPKKYGTYNFIHRLDGKIIAVGIWDILPTSLSSVYLYYDTDYQFLDLGVFTAIREIEYVKSFHDLIDNNFKYYMMGFYCETVQKLRYKGFYQPTELLDRYTMNYVYLKDVQKLISDGKNHKLSNKENNPNKKFLTKDEINKYVNELKVEFKNGFFMRNIQISIFDFANNFIRKEYSKLLIDLAKRFIEIIPTDILNKIKFVANFS